MMKTTPAGARSLVHDRPVAGLRVIGRRRLFWFRKLFRGMDCITIGRTRQREIRIRGDKSVSREHALVSRTDDGRFVIEDWGATNGVYVASRGRYSAYRDVDVAVLELGMLVRLGNTTLIPIDERGHCPVLVSSRSELIRNAHAMYGTARGTAQQIGISRNAVVRFLRRVGRAA